MKILFINHKLTKSCGIYDFGIRYFDNIKKIKEYDIIYEEIDSQNYYQECIDKYNPSGVVFNYANIFFEWLNKSIFKNYKTYCIPHFFKSNNIENNIFDYVLVPDKNFIEKKGFYKTNRPLFEYKSVYEEKNSFPKIGSFGFGLLHKNFDKIVSHVNEVFDLAEINFHMPRAHFDTANEIPIVINKCEEKNKKKLIINFNHNLITQKNLLNFLNSNDINCLFYDEEYDPGISSSLDYLISCQKPILVTNCLMFRSFINEVEIFPNKTLKNIYDNFEYYKLKIKKSYNDSFDNLKNDFKNILDKTL